MLALLGLGLAAMKASSEAETVAEAEAVAEAEPVAEAEAEAVAEAEVWDDEGDPDGEPAPDGELDGEPDPEAEPDGEGGAGVLLEALLGLVVGAGEVEELEADGDGVGVGVGDFDGFGVGVGVGVGEDVLEAGSTWHLVLVSLSALTLVEVPELGGAAMSLSVPARAVPGKHASTPSIRKPPASTLNAADRRCARRMRIALPRLLIRVTVCSRWVRRQLGDGWV